MRSRIGFFAVLFSLALLFVSTRAQDEPNVEEEVQEVPKIYEVEYEAEEPGSGDNIPLPECKLSYIKFERYYLRGVKEPNYLSYNGSSFRDCEKRCCYESDIDCKSFSYFHALRVCFIMNVTKEYSKVSLISVGSWTHVERVANREVTTAMIPDWTTAALDGEETTVQDTVEVYETTPLNLYPDGGEDMGSGYDPDGSGSHMIPPKSNPTGKEDSTTTTFNSPSWTPKTKSTKTTTTQSAILDESKRMDKIVDNSCAKRCLYDGVCENKIIVEEGQQRIAQVCKCEEGYTGEQCENKVSEAGPGGLPVYVIILIVLGSIILILFLTVFIMYQIYRRKTGEYKVVKHIQKWTRRGKKKKATGNPEDFANPEATHTSPTTSVQSIHGSVTSSTTHSTTTSV